MRYVGSTTAYSATEKLAAMARHRCSCGGLPRLVAVPLQDRAAGELVAGHLIFVCH